MFLTAILSALVVSAADFNLNVPSTVPSTNSSIVYPSFTGLAFEWNAMIAYAQTSASNSAANQYSINLIQNFAKRSKGKPSLRMGGNSVGNQYYNPSLSTAQNYFPSDTCGSSCPTYQFGPSYWSSVRQAFSSITNILYIPQMPRSPPNQTYSDSMANAIVSGLETANIYAVEFDNEPNCAGAQTYACSASALKTLLVNDYSSISKAWSNNGGGSNPPVSGPDYCGEGGPAQSCPSGITPPGYTLQSLFSSTNNFQQYIDYATNHYYMINNYATTLQAAMTHSKTVNSANNAGLKSDAQFFNSKNIRYILSEVNIENGSQNGAALRKSLAGSLAELDFYLYAMSIGISQVHFESAYGSTQSLWVPQTTPGGVGPVTQQGYYALLAATDFYAGADHVAEVIASGSAYQYTTFATYVSYTNNVVNSIAVLNLNYWTSAAGSRPVRTMTVSGIPSGVTTVKVNYLTATNGAADTESTISYGTYQYLASNQGQASSFDQYGASSYTVTNGQATINIADSCAGIVTW